MASNMFMNQPRLTGLRAMCRTTGTRIAIISRPAITSITMNRVIWKPPDRRQVDLPVETSGGDHHGISIVS